jgi:hypothetical protein
MNFSELVAKGVTSTGMGREGVNNTFGGSGGNREKDSAR